MRLDKYLKVSRIIKRRTVANDACSGGRVSVKATFEPRLENASAAHSATLQLLASLGQLTKAPTLAACAPALPPEGAAADLGRPGASIPPTKSSTAAPAAQP